MNDNAPSGEDREAEAAQWYARLKTLPVSADTLSEFFAWRKTPENSEAFDTVDCFYTSAGALAGRPAIAAATDQAMRRSANRSAPRWRHGATAAVAAVIAVVGIATIAAWPWGGDRYSTAIGERRTIALADGSRIMLDTDTLLTVELAKDARRVSLVRGQAYFTVAHDASRPFTVDASDTHVLATGTEFDVHRSGQQIDVMLVQGHVRISSGEHVVAQLQPGQALTVDGERATPVRAIDTTPRLAWMRGRIVLDGMTLERAVAEVNRYVKTPVRLDAARFANTRISGTVDAGDTGSFTKAVTAILPLKSEINSDGSITLQDRQPNAST